MDTNASYHQVIVKTDTPTNTGPVKLYSRVIDIKWGKAQEFIDNNPQYKVIRIVDIRR